MRGGKRSGSGRKRLHSKGVAHRKREKINAYTPMHINFRFRTTVRNKESLRILKRSIQNARSHGLRITHFSFQTNHVHLIVEADSNSILTKGMRSLTNTFAKCFDRGRIQTGRYHLHALRTVREVKNAVYYVLFNQQKHEKGTCSTIDGYSSVLSLKKGIQMIRIFAKRMKMKLKIVECETWDGDPAKSFLLQRGYYG